MSEVTVQGTEHWTRKGDVRLFLWRKSAVEPRDAKGTILFVHGSSMASQPTFDLHVPGRPDSSAMDWFVARGFDTLAGSGGEAKTLATGGDVRVNGEPENRRGRKLRAGDEVHLQGDVDRLLGEGHAALRSVADLRQS